MSKKVRWGVIGSGGIAKRRTIPEGIVPARNGDLISVFDIDPDINKAVADEFGAYAAASIEAMLNSDIDAVYIATPADAHCQQVFDCAKAGKHALCEKPLGLSVEEAQKMMQACKDAGVILGTALMMRFHTQHQAALHIVQEGKLGEPTFARAQLSCWYPPIENAWRQNLKQGGGGSLIDMGGHCIDLLEMYFGSVKKVNCMINNTIHNYESEDSAVVSLFFENGAMASVDAFFCIPDASSKNCLELYGSTGSILAQGTIGQGEAGTMTAFLEEKDASYDAQQDDVSNGGIEISPKPFNTYQAEIEEMGNAILEGREPSNSAELGLRNQMILAACYESARSGRMVSV